MAGANNIFNAEPLDILLEAIERSSMVRLRREFIVATIASQTNTTTTVRLTPKAHNGMTLYAFEHEHVVDKLNLNGRMPKDVCYSGAFPLTFEALVTFFSTTYGLELRTGEWTFRQGGVTVALDQAFTSNKSYVGDRMFYLSPSAAHPILRGASFELPVMITEPLVGSST